MIYNGRLSSKYKEGDIYLGYTPSFTEDYPGKRFKGGIGEVIIKSQGETVWKLSDNKDYHSENVEKKEEEMNGRRIRPFRSGFVHLRFPFNQHRLLQSILV